MSNIEKRGKFVDFTIKYNDSNGGISFETILISSIKDIKVSHWQCFDEMTIEIYTDIMEPLQNNDNLIAFNRKIILHYECGDKEEFITKEQADIVYKDYKKLIKIIEENN